MKQAIDKHIHKRIDDCIENIGGNILEIGYESNVISDYILSDNDFRYNETKVNKYINEVLSCILKIKMSCACISELELLEETINEVQGFEELNNVNNK